MISKPTDNRGIRIFAFGWLLLVLAAWQSPAVFAFCHALVDIFAGGRSVIKTWLFLAYLPVIVIAQHLLKGRKVKSRSIITGVFAGVLVGGFSLNLASYAYFVRRHGFALRDWVLTFADNGVSSTSLLHNHVMKGAIGLVLSRVGVKDAANLDAGLAYVNLMPHWFFWLGALLLLAALACTATYFAVNFPQDPARKNWAGAVPYAILTFSLVKNLVDGGPFSHEAVISLIFFLALLYPHRRIKIGAWTLAALYVAAQGLPYALGFGDPSVPAMTGWFRAVLSSSALVMLLAPFYYFQGHGRWGREGLMLTTFSGLVLACFMANELHVLDYRATIITAEDPAILGLYGVPKEPQAAKLGDIGSMSFYEMEPARPTTAGAIIDEYHLLDNYYPLAFPYRDCLPHGREAGYGFTLVTAARLNLTTWRDSLAGFAQFELIKEAAGEYFYSVKLALKPCLPRPVNVIQEILRRELGLKEAFVLNIKNLPAQ